jgi:hypothetical protein
MDKESIKNDTEVIGIVFPVYYATNDCGISLIIGRFIRKLENIGSKYLFIVCTSGYMPGETIENLSKLIKSRGAKLAAGFTVLRELLRLLWMVPGRVRSLVQFDIMKTIRIITSYMKFRTPLLKIKNY